MSVLVCDKHGTGCMQVGSSPGYRPGQPSAIGPKNGMSTARGTDAAGCFEVTASATALPTVYRVMAFIVVALYGDSLPTAYIVMALYIQGPI